MAHEIRLPELGHTSDELHIVSWHKQVGDRVEIAEPLLVVETDKAQVDVESAEEGVLLRIVAEAGETLRTGDLVAFVGEPGEVLPASEHGGMTWH